MQDINCNSFVCGHHCNENAEVYLDVDFQHWAKMPFWNHLELSCVTLGFEPAPILTATLGQLQSDNAKFELISKRSQLAHRAVEIGDLPECAPPKKAIDWLALINEDCPKGLKEAICGLPIYADGPLQDLRGKNLTSLMGAIESLTDTVQGFDNSSTRSSTQTKELASLQKILLTMAIKGYCYDPSAKRNTVYGEIANDATSIGVNVHVDTVRKHLQLAVDNHWCQDQG